MHFTRVRTQSDCEGALVTVFCAVWHRQNNKLELLKSHYINVRQQSVSVRIVYIFDNGDMPPEWLDADCYVFSHPLSIYEAWSAAVAVSNSLFVMNLNMDDRLATNAVELLVGAACASSAALVGGEWLICFDNSHLDEPFKAPILTASEFAPDWPPKPRERLRLGSGSGERGTLGPATLWSLQAVGKYYPSYFGDGSLIKSIGDALFWNVFQQKNLKTVRLPLLIGKYFSSPSDQAEFRGNQDNELYQRFGVSNLSFADRILGGEVPQLAFRPAG
ncbi:glycosyltransferase family 2 protein [Rhizobium binxianense]|uniref:glycosyltransferase family 2 protein n=1 Tax=Rhizobium binxianense TaxID=3024242 RepID=UPI00236029D4|nr:glycosyltransferase family 2 protein [Rhizobium sp. MJ37]MDC9831796.1 glycosyltransferase family 2 protein [Rhizobium sp. MJ37]